MPYDVFLCHNGEDKPAVRKIAADLKARGIRPWLDEEEIRPGTSWQEAISRQIQEIRSAAVFVGETGFGPWQNHEIQGLLSQFVNRRCPVIPVVLPTATSTPEWPWTLSSLHRVDFRESNPDPIDQLVWGITGERPSRGKEVGMLSQPLRVEALLPGKQKQVIEIRLLGDRDGTSDDERDKILQSLSARLLDVGDVTLTRQSLRGSVRHRVEVNSADADQLYAAAMEGRLADLGIVDARLYPSIAKPPDRKARSRLLVLLDLVYEQWIEGVLRRSLYSEVLISLGKQIADEAVEPRRTLRVELPEHRKNLQLRNLKTETIFDATGLLLILGEPGSGKTTTLLDLASHLLDRARAEPKERIPFVLNLSSWRKGQRLEEWVLAELNSKYLIPFRIGSSWLKNDYLLPLLDGLDEVPTSLQPACVAAINAFVESAKPAGLVVCSRLMEYQWLPERLKLNGAISLEPLTREEVSAFLVQGGAQCEGLRETVSRDLVLQDLARSPLMLSIMCLAYSGHAVETGDADDSQTPSLGARRKKIFSLYVDRMFGRKAADERFPRDQAIEWLSWLAKGVQKHSQSVFFVESLQPSWLESPRQRAWYRSLVALVVGLIVGLIVGLALWASVGLIFGLIFGLGFGLSERVISKPIDRPIERLALGMICGLISGLVSELISRPSDGLSAALPVGLYAALTGGLIGGGTLAAVGAPSRISTVETLNWNWSTFLLATLKFGLIVWLAMELSALSTGLVIVVGGRTSARDAPSLLLMLLSFGLYVGLMGGLIGGLIFGVARGIEDDVKAHKSAPNDGVVLSFKNAVKAGILSCLFFGSSFWLSSRLIGVSIDSIAVLFSALVGGLFVGLKGGGSAVVKHYSLRIVLWRAGCTPYRFIPFLDYAVKLILLKKVGGSYIFLHRTLREYFAELGDESDSRLVK